MRRCAPLLALVVIFVTSCVGCGRQESNVVATVNNQPISQAQLCQALEQAEDMDPRRLETQKLIVLQVVYEELALRGVTVDREDAVDLRRRVDAYFGGAFPAAGAMSSLGARTLDSLIVRQVIRQEAEKRNVSVSREDLDARFDGLKDYVLAAAGKDFEAWLADTGQTEEDLASRISTQILTGKLVFTDDDRNKYFEESKQRLEALPHNNKSVIYREIILPSKEEAEAVHKELLAGASEGKVTSEKFARVATERTLDPVERRRGGMAGWIVEGKRDDPKLEKVLFELTPGEASEPIPIEMPGPEEEEGTSSKAPGPQFYRIVMVEKRITPGELTLARNADVIEEWMLNDPRFQPQLQQFFINLRAKADVKILSPRYKALEEAYREGREARERRLSQTEDIVPTLPQPEGETQSPGAEQMKPSAETQPE